MEANARSRRTRAELLTSARAIVEESGFAALTMGAVADRAGVTRRAVYLHFPSRGELVAMLFDAVAKAEGLEASARPVWAAADAATALDLWARHVARFHLRVLAVTRAVEHVHRSDPDAAAHRRRYLTEQHAACRKLAARLQRDGALASDWTVPAAADMLFALMSSGMLERLAEERGWSQARIADKLSMLLRRTFLEPRGRRGAK